MSQRKYFLPASVLPFIFFFSFKLQAMPMWNFFSRKVACESIFNGNNEKVVPKKQVDDSYKNAFVKKFDYLNPENQMVFEYFVRQVDRFQMSSHYRFSYIKPQISEFSEKLQALSSPRAGFADFADVVARYVALVRMQSAMTLDEILMRKNLTVEGRENFFRNAYNKSYFETRSLLQELLEEMKLGPDQYQLTFLVSTDNDVNHMSLHRGHFESETRRILARESGNLIVHLPRPRIDQSAEDERKVEGIIFSKDILHSKQMILRDREEYKDLHFHFVKDWQIHREKNHKKLIQVLESLESQDFVLQENVYTVLMDALYMKAYTLDDFVAILSLDNKSILAEFNSEVDLTDAIQWLRDQLIGQNTSK